MNYKQIIINGYTEKGSQGTPYVSYFKRESQKAKRDNFVEFEDFFNGCNFAIRDYKNQIEREYRRPIVHLLTVENQYRLALIDGQTTDANGVSIQERIDNLEKDINYYEKTGYKDNNTYFCLTTKTGNIVAVNNLDGEHKLYYQDVSELEQAIEQAGRELIHKPHVPAITTAPPLHFTRSFTNKERKTLFNGLVKGGFIPKDTNYNHFSFVFGDVETADFEPLQWQMEKQDLKMFIDTFFPSELSKWKKTVFCFTDKGSPIKKDSIKNLNPSYKDNPKSAEYFNELKQRVKQA